MQWFPPWLCLSLFLPRFGSPLWSYHRRPWVPPQKSGITFWLGRTSSRLCIALIFCYPSTSITLEEGTLYSKGVCFRCTSGHPLIDDGCKVWPPSFTAPAHLFATAYHFSLQHGNISASNLRRFFHHGDVRHRTIRISLYDTGITDLHQILRLKHNLYLNSFRQTANIQ